MSARPRISGRMTSLAHAFVHAIIPRCVDPQKQRQLFERAGIKPSECVYCGASATDSDHFRGLVKGGRPSGHFHTPDNLVPSCGTCNQSKGAADWRKWMTGNAPGSLLEGAFTMLRNGSSGFSRSRRSRKRWQAQRSSFASLPGLSYGTVIGQSSSKFGKNCLRLRRMPRSSDHD